MKGMNRVVFYSWQSDLPNPSNRSFIEKALEKAVKAIADDESIKVQPVIDRDTAGVGGSPDIAATIFGKIEKADVFVADVSIINNDASAGRKVPNPNVLIELGYALKVLGHNRVILVMNKEFGGLESLPFDLRTRRVLTYDTQQEKKKEQSELASKLQSQLAVIFESEMPVEDIQPTIVDLIKGQKPDRISGIKVYMKTLNKDFESLYPGNGMVDATTPDPEYDQKIIDALEKTRGLVLTFRSVVDEIALYDDKDALKALFHGFKPILENYDRNRNTPDGTFHKARYDYYKFLGDELFVILTSILLREEKWDLLQFILTETIIIDNYGGYNTEAVDFTYFSDYAACFGFRKTRLKSNRVDLRYDLLMERRKSETDQVSNAAEEYSSADLFLFLRGEISKVNSTDALFNWRPWSLVGFDLPRFVLLARSKSYAENIAKALGVPHAQELQILLKNKVPNIGRYYTATFWRNPISDEHIQQIGTR